MSGDLDLLVYASVDAVGEGAYQALDVITLAQDLGYRAALAPLFGAPLFGEPGFGDLSSGLGAERSLAQAVALGQVDVIDQARVPATRVALVLDPLKLTEQAPRARADRSLLVDHPDVGPEDLARIEAGAEALSGRAPGWVSRAGAPSLWRLGRKGADAPAWRPLLDPRRWRQGQRPRPASPLRLGRWGGPLDPDWLPTGSQFFTHFPLGRHQQLRLLGAGSEITTLFSGAAPDGWFLLPLQSLAPERFLQDLHLYMAAPNPGPDFRCLAAALCGALPLLAPEDHSQAGVALGHPRDWVETVLAGLMAPEFLNAQQAAAREKTLADHGREACARFLGDVIGPPQGQGPAHVTKALSPIGETRVGNPHRPRAAAATDLVFITANGTGMGHITRCLAYARRLPKDLRCHFITFSQAASVIAAAGHSVDYLPFHKVGEQDPARWSLWLQQELAARLRVLSPKAVVFDGQFPFKGILEAAAQFPDLSIIWSRRAMWRPATWPEALARAALCDLIIEPGDWAESEDKGATCLAQEGVAKVGPVLLLEEADLLSEAEARRSLGLDPSRPAALVQLGSGGRVAVSASIEKVTSHLTSCGVQVVAVSWLMAEGEAQEIPGVKVLRDYPNARFLKAFDFAVSAAGYNAFHELLAFGVPTLFLALDAPDLDDQPARARWAHSQGLAISSAAEGLQQLEPLLNEIRAKEMRASLSAKLAVLPRPCGAQDAADLIVSCLS